MSCSTLLIHFPCCKELVGEDKTIGGPNTFLRSVQCWVPLLRDSSLKLQKGSEYLSGTGSVDVLPVFRGKNMLRIGNIVNQ